MFKFESLRKLDNPTTNLIGFGKLDAGPVRIDVRIMQRKSDGTVFCAMPSYPDKKDPKKYWDHCYLTDKEDRDKVNEILVKEWAALGSTSKTPSEETNGPGNDAEKPVETDTDSPEPGKRAPW